MKLWRVHLDIDVMVVAAEADEAEDAAIAAAALGEGVNVDDAYASEITEAREIPKAWRRCIPFYAADDGEMTCEQFLRAAATVESDRLTSDDS